MRIVPRESLEAGMTGALGAARRERLTARLGCRVGHYGRTPITVDGGAIDRQAGAAGPQDRDGRFPAGPFGCCRRSGQALVATLAEMYVQGVSTRKVEAITEESCGRAFPASAIPAINRHLDKSLAAFARRREEPFAHPILDARYEKVRKAGVVRSQAMLVAVGIDRGGQRRILAVEPASRENRSSRKDFLPGLRERRPHAVGFVEANDHAGLRAAIRKVLPEATFQRCDGHFLRAGPSAARPTTIVCRSCAGSITTARWRANGGAISFPGSLTSP